MKRILNLESLRYTEIDGVKFYALVDVRASIKKRKCHYSQLLKGVDKKFIKKGYITGRGISRKSTCICEQGIMQILERINKNMKKRYSRTEKENIARRYGWTYGFVEGHIQAGDLDYQIEYAEKYCKPKKKIRRYDMRGFSGMMLCEVE